MPWIISNTKPFNPIILNINLVKLVITKVGRDPVNMYIITSNQPFRIIEKNPKDTIQRIPAILRKLLYLSWLALPKRKKNSP